MEMNEWNLDVKDLVGEKISPFCKTRWLDVELGQNVYLKLTLSFKVDLIDPRWNNRVLTNSRVQLE